MRMMSERRIHAYRRESTLSTLSDENLKMTSIVMTALCNQPEAFASDLGDDQSRYL